MMRASPPSRAPPRPADLAASGRLITVSALQPEPAGDDEAFLSIWSAP